MASRSSIQALVEARDDHLKVASENRDAAALMSWYSKDAVFKDPVQGIVQTGPEAIGRFYETAYAAMPTFKVVEAKATAPTAEFVAAEMTCEAVPAFDMPALGIKTGENFRLKGVSLFWWRWEGPGHEWDGSLEGEQLRGWKIIEEHVYFTPSKSS